jgi:ribose transport system permease protein
MAKNIKEAVLKANEFKLTDLPLTVVLGIFMLILFSQLSTKFMTVSNMMNVIVQVASGVGIISIAAFMAICSTGVDLSLGGTIAFAGMTAGKIIVWDLPILNSVRAISPVLVVIIAVIAASIVGLLIGALNGLILSKTKIPAFIVTLATFRIGETMARIIGQGTSIKISDETFRFLGGGSLYSVMIGERTIGLLPVTMLVMIPLYVIFQIIMKRTRFGTHVYAIGGNYDAAVLSGINVERTRFMVFLLNGLLAAFAGILLASRLASAIAATGLGMEFDGIAAAVVGGASMTGGKSTPLRTLIGAFLIGTLRNGLNLIGMENSLQMITIGLVMGIIVAVDVTRSKGE